jgi:hypothetical protein
MSTVTIADNIYDPSTWQTIHGVDNINELLHKRYGAHFPSTGRIYFRYVAESCDVTPHNEAEINRLERLNGQFFVMIYPEGFLVIAIIIAVVLAAVAIGLAFLLRNSAKPDTSASPNNTLSDRQNSNRPGERIPDIVGCVRSTPDLIAIPYRVFIGNQEVEYDYMCIGRGYFKVTEAIELTGSVTGPIAYDIKEDQTFVEQIDGNSVAVYAPYTSPNSGDAPQLLIGAAINEPIKNVMKSSSIIGQILRAPNDNTVIGYGNTIRCVNGGLVQCNDTSIDFTAYFAIGDNLQLINAGTMGDPGGVHSPADLNGTYPVLAVSTNQVTLQLTDPITGVEINTNWDLLADFTGGASTYQSITLTATGSRVIGPYILDVENLTEVWANFVAPDGLFKISSSSGNQYEVDDTVTMYVQALDENYVPVGGIVSSSCVIYGSAILQTQRATTLKIVLPERTDGRPAGRVQVSAVRVSGYDTSWQGTNQDTIQWRDLYAVSPIPMTEFGDVTTLQTMNYATPSALVAPERKLNLEVTRLWPLRDPDTHLPIGPFGMAVTMSTSLAYDTGGGAPLTYGIVFNGMNGVVPTGSITVLFDGTASTTIDGPFAASVGDTIVDSTDGAHTLTFEYSGDSNYAPISLTASYNILEPSGSDPIAPPFTVAKNVPFTNLFASTNAADAIVNLALDPYIGDRQISEVDFDGIYATVGTGGAVDAYFGCPYCSQFCYTFDDTQTSFEEMMSDIGQACFFQPYRRGSTLEVYFEEQTDISTILFNHRNKVPGSETRTVSFGLTNDYDGIELDYIDPNAPNYPELETTVTLYYPPLDGDPTQPGAATNPRKIKTVGVRNNVQATIMGWRMYQKMLYQNTACEFRATSEASLVINTQRILVADNTRPDTQDGQVLAQVGLQLTLSQPVLFIAGQDAVIFLQHYDGTVENISITADPTNGVNPVKGVVVLAQAPATPLVLDPSMFAATTYQIAGPPNLTFRSSEITIQSRGYPAVGDVPEKGIIDAGDVDLIDNVNVGDTVILSGVMAVDRAGIQPTVDISGAYTVLGVNTDDAQLVLDVDWTFMDAFEYGLPATASGTIRVIRPQVTPQATPFLLSTKEAEDGLVYKCQAINYDDRYYYHDTDFIEGYLVLNGSTESNVGFADTGGGGSEPRSSNSASTGAPPSSNPFSGSAFSTTSGGSGARSESGRSG